MPKVNQGYQIDRDRSINTGPLANYVVDSVGWGTDATADGDGPSYPILKLGAGAGENSYWKSGGDVSITTGGDGTVNPFWQLEATWGPLEISESPSETVVLREVGTAAGSLTGTNPAGNADTALSGLYTRKRVGGSLGIGKTSDFSLVARIRVDF